MHLELSKNRKKQKKLYVTFRNNKEELELYNWCSEKAKIGGVANFFKLLALREKQRQEGK